MLGIQKTLLYEVDFAIFVTNKHQPSVAIFSKSLPVITISSLPSRYFSHIPASAAFLLRPRTGQNIRPTVESRRQKELRMEPQSPSRLHDFKGAKDSLVKGSVAQVDNIVALSKNLYNI
jgi:hypothetical protein